MFTHLHVSSGYSFKYGTASAAQLVERSAQFGMKALGLTDRDGMAGVIRFVQECESQGIAPIVGVNLSFLQKKYRVTLLAQGGTLPALYRLVSAVNRDSANEKILTFETLEKFSEYSSQLLALHGPDSYLATTIASRRNESALSIFNSTRELFASQSLEIISHRTKGDGPFSTTHAAKLLGFARENDIPAVLTNAVRMLDRTDGPVADVLDSARLLVPLHQRHVERTNSEAYLKSEAEMVFLADEISRGAGESHGRNLLRTTEEWAERSMLSPSRDVGIGSIHLPEPAVFGATRHEELANQLRKRSESSLHRYTGALSVRAAERLEEELSTVRKLGYEAYFLAVADIADIARAKGIRVAARGSGAGSLICYLLGISGVEPLSQGLLMERFCSPLRNELPDIDIDVESARRLEIYDAIFKRFGPDRTATVAMVETYRARHAIRDTGAALGISPMEIDLIAKSLPHIRARNIGKALENLPELKNLKLDTPLMKAAIYLAGRLDGLPRHLSMHPCAVLLSDDRLLDIAPTEINASGYAMVQFDKDDVEAIGLLKLDVLGVRMQSAISYSLQEIERLEGVKVDIDGVPLDDPQTFDLIKSTRTLGLFQIESPGQRELVGKFSPQTFTDLVIDISLFRPGPVKSDMITPFINTRHGFRSKPVIHPDLDDILHETEGVVVFHEQVIRIIAVMTGISLAEADEKRRALSTFEGQQEVCDWFYPTAISQGYELSLVTEVWEILRAFASFGFCKAHAAAFALPTYQSAWLKSHHTAAFLAGVLTHDPGMYPRRVILDEARQWGIEIAPIDINISDKSYRAEKIDQSNQRLRAPYQAPNTASTGAKLTLPDSRGYAIRIGFSDIHGINDKEISSILENRPYVDLADFVHRTGVSKPTTEALLLVGAFDSLYRNQEINRRDLLLHLHDIDKFSRVKSKNGHGQMALQLLPSKLEASGLPPLTASERIRNEVALTGMDISHHMMEFYGEFLNSIGAVRSSDLIHQRSGATVLVAGVKVALQTPPVRSGRRVMFLTIDDGYGCNDVTFFEDAQGDHANLLYNSWLFLVRGVVRKTGARGISLRAISAWELGESYSQWRNLSGMKAGISHE